MHLKLFANRYTRIEEAAAAAGCGGMSTNGIFSRRMKTLLTSLLLVLGRKVALTLFEGARAHSGVCLPTIRSVT